MWCSRDRNSVKATFLTWRVLCVCTVCVSKMSYIMFFFSPPSMVATCVMLRGTVPRPA